MNTVTVKPLGARVTGDYRRLRDQIPGWRPLKPYRLNLVQLSQEHNLIFVARGSQIHVSEPSFPGQGLPLTAPLVLDGQPSSLAGGGYIDHRDPHSINNLLVNHLGSEEIIVAARDDGDVDAYLVRHILRAVQRRRDSQNQLGQRADDVRPMLHINVGNSAWGLAIHNAARLIAVSSNNHEVSVITFALVEDSSELRPSRSRDRLSILSQGDANVPCISFCNTGHDPSGQWLLTTDVSGVTRSWDLHRIHHVNDVHLCPRRVQSMPSTFEPEAAGWIVDFLDPRTFVTRPTFEAGVSTLEHPLKNLRLDRPAWDLSEERIHLPTDAVRSRSAMRSLSALEAVELRDSTKRFPLVQKQSDRRIDPLRHVYVNVHSEFMDQRNAMDRVVREALGFPPLDEVAPGPNSASPPHTRHLETNVRLQDSTEATITISNAGPVMFGYNVSFNESVESSDLSDEGDDQSMSEDMNEDLAHALSERQSADGEPLDEDSDTSDVDLDSGDDEYTAERERSLYVAFNNGSALCPGLPCPLFISSVDSMYMLQPSTSTASEHLPLIYMGDHWKAFELVPLQNGLNRGSMVAHIPALGVIIIGNQNGRVAIMSGFKSHQTLNITNKRMPPIKTTKWVYGLHLEAMLPFPEQERGYLRPRWNLFGLAVSPIQGSQHLCDDEKTWRLVMMYLDETVLSYELKRRPDHGGLDVMEMVI